MKKLAYLLAALTLLGCSSPKTIDGYTYGTYGLINESEMKNPGVEYKISAGNVVWAVVLCETVVAPIYLFGFDLYEPVGKKAPSWEPGRVQNQ